MACDDSGFVGRQYVDAANLDARVSARVSLHERFSTNPTPWHRWVFDRLDLPDDASILEVGCGPGNLWAENRDRLPRTWSVTLTDVSGGMVEEARLRLSGAGDLHFRTADARSLPFRESCFDAVISNHMLHHLPERDAALYEISRVLRADGVPFATTNGQNTLREMGWMQRILDPSRPDDRYFQAPPSFSLQNGGQQLSRRFERVSLLRYGDALVVTEVEPLLGYLLSGAAADAARVEAGPDALRRRTALLEEEIYKKLAAEGEIRISKHTGLFLARGPR